ncbi:hypothetical protein PC9H_006871 [Pleurotus ostreatus]|uniref:DUF6534 domain-containing protein n=1 Tax=Pleurotus ostreatus TaxID=5322 RepID=A0A8H6ZUI6_PLEOS|nr:uncharacterized protein PC9H_006871 [Pleurotus ostreatus]KAF7431151.1 hypothetical protein PC9H_006871 [Pleurotus ostreatus]
MSSPRIHIDDTFGAAFVGVIVAAVLATVYDLFIAYLSSLFVVLGCMVYRVLKPGTISRIKTTSGSLRRLHILQQFTSSVVYTYLVSNYNNQEQLKYLVWSVLVEVLFNGFTAFLVQSTAGLAANVWLTGLVAFLVLSEFGCVLAFAALSLRFTTYEQLATLKELSITVNALGAAGDVVIAFALCVLLHRSRTGFQRSDSMINKLIIFAVNTGVLTSLCAIASLISASLASSCPSGIRPTQTNISIMIDTTKEFATDVEPSTQSQQMDDITDALEMEIMSTIADEEKQSGSSNMSLDSTSKVTFIYEGEGKVTEQV